MKKTITIYHCENCDKELRDDPLPRGTIYFEKGSYGITKIPYVPHDTIGTLIPFAGVFCSFECLHEYIAREVKARYQDVIEAKAN